MKKVIGILLTVAALAGCFQQETVTKKVVVETNNTMNLSVSEKFNFETTTNVAVSITAEGLEGAGFEVYSEDPATGAEPLITWAFNAESNYSFALPVATGTENLFVKSTDGSFADVTAAVVDGKVAAVLTKQPAAIKRGMKIVKMSISSSQQIIAFEDKWPAKGDYDFNDLIVRYWYEVNFDVDSSKSKLKPTSLTLKYQVLAAGAHDNAGFGIELKNTLPGAISKVTGSVITDNGVTLTAKGLEAGQTTPVIIAFDNAKKQFANGPAGYDVNKYYNTVLDSLNASKLTVDQSNQIKTIDVTFDTSVSSVKYNSSSLTTILDSYAEIANPFLFGTDNRGKEIHLKNSLPTALVDVNLLGAVDDASSKTATGNHYLSNDGKNLPWAISIPAASGFRHTIEKTKISDAYSNFAQWATSNGTQKKNWYNAKKAANVTNENLLYTAIVGETTKK